MSTGIFLSYKGLGANLLHLSYCHEIAKKIEPVEIITLSNNLSDVIENDPLIKKVIYLDKYHKKITDIIKLSNFLKVPVVYFFEDYPLYAGSLVSKDESEDLNYSFLAKLFSALSEQKKEKIFQVLKNTRNLEKTA